ncbi:hypothetical protein SPX_05990 [Sporomusa paucivorans]|uniref:Uncharacterized protein n=1 Tax=Sporomusa sphaeroides DSM 2875 TaxID=1337886 RepID=A0ABP2C3H5_9FIRM|nr:hypothetical protein SPSPH_05880 [Sporomusa sphaeroides DSM 2875]CVK18272.1 hypothetical protein SSPH_00909 [Sporomusa sphaeroides DSM 2875]
MSFRFNLLIIFVIALRLLAVAQQAETFYLERPTVLITKVIADSKTNQRSYI